MSGALTEALVAAQRPQDEPPRVLLVPCLACNREAGEPMCTLCDAMTRAEEEAEQDPREAAVRGRTMTAREPWFAARRIYVASSWRNPDQPLVVAALRQLGHEVYDFRNPRAGDNGFAWSEIDPDWLGWTPRPFRELLDHPIAVSGFASDFDAMQWADTFVLALPCGRSAHLEAGWAIGVGKPTAILLHEDKFEPELMYRMADTIACDLDEVTGWVDALAQIGTPSGQITHGRHCRCSACAREDWARITSLCGMHGAECPAAYAPLRPANSQSVPRP